MKIWASAPESSRSWTQAVGSGASGYGEKDANSALTRVASLPVSQRIASQQWQPQSRNALPSFGSVAQWLPGARPAPIVGLIGRMYRMSPMAPSSMSCLARISGSP
jgi:hypothetical protein